jgi:hypothetical protein
MLKTAFPNSSTGEDARAYIPDADRFYFSRNIAFT